MYSKGRHWSTHAKPHQAGSTWWECCLSASFPMCHTGKASPKVLLPVQPTLRRSNTLGAQFLKMVHLREKSIHVRVHGMQLGNMVSKNGSLLFQMICRAWPCAWQALVALCQCHCGSHDQSMITFAQIQMLDQLHHPGHHLPDGGCLGLQTGGLVPEPAQRQVFQSVSLHLLLLVKTQQHMPQGKPPGLNGDPKPWDPRGVHKETQQATSKCCCDTLVCYVQPVELKADLPEQWELPNWGQLLLTGLQPGDQPIMVNPHVSLSPTSRHEVLRKVFPGCSAKETDPFFVVPPGEIEDIGEKLPVPLHLQEEALVPQWLPCKFLPIALLESSPIMGQTWELP